MEPFTIKPTPSTPLVNFDPISNTLLIIGESYPENSFDFYAPLIVWLKTSLLELHELTLDIAVTYMNSSSTKCTFDILDALEEAANRGANCRIIWRYNRENP